MKLILIEWQSDFGISSVALKIENIVHDSPQADSRQTPDKMSGPVVDMSGMDSGQSKQLQIGPKKIAVNAREYYE